MTFQEENNQAASLILNKFLNVWTLPFEEQEKLYPFGTSGKLNSLEFFITPYCNQKCNYCYLMKHKEDLYPSNISDNKIILKNLRIFLDYCLEKKYFYIKQVDLFSGEIWGYPFGNQILDIILEYLDKGIQIKCLCIPSNCSFCNSKDFLKIIENYILQFKIRHCDLVFSISYDGVVLDNLSRPSLNQNIFDKTNEKYIDNIFTFAEKYDFGFHPMISQFGIESQIENYAKWIELIKKYWGTKNFESTYGIVMQLETREVGWTDEKIVSYLKWLKFLIDTDIKEYFHNSPKDFCETCLKDGYQGDSRFGGTYMPYSIQSMGPDLAGCDFATNLQLRLGDLAYVPCHRTSYKQFILGHYIVENNHIVDFYSENLPLMNSMYITGLRYKPFCIDCPLLTNCSKNCFGANFEANKELFYPEPSNCNLQKAKVIFMIHYYKKLGFIDELPCLLTNKKLLKEKEPEVYNKWSIIIQQII